MMQAEGGLVDFDKPSIFAQAGILLGPFALLSLSFWGPSVVTMSS